MSARRIVVLTVATLSLAGCPGARSDYVWSDDLEGPLCEGAPCGWERLAGPPEAATWAESLPGEHGIVLTGSEVVVGVRPNLALERGTSDATLLVDVIARCDLGSSLSMEVAATDRFSRDEQGFAPMVNTLTSWTDPRRNRVQLGSTGTELSSIDAIRFAKVGAGSCEIDFVGLVDQTFRP